MDSFLGDGAPAVQHPDPDRPPVFHEDLLNILGHPNRATGLLDAFFEGTSYPCAAACWEPPSVQVVVDDQRMLGEGAARGRQPVVAPLAGQ